MASTRPRRGARRARGDAAGTPGTRPRRSGILRGLFLFRGQTPASTRVYIGAGTFAGLLLTWLIITESGLVAEQFLPSPLAVVRALYDLFATGGFSWDVGISIYRVWVAFLIAAVMSVPLGIFMSSFPAVGTVTEPVVDFVRYLPVPALVPLTIIWFGIGEMSKIILLWMGTFFQLVLLIADDAKRVPREFIETGWTLGARSWQIIKDIVFPAMAPSMVDNLRITLGWCWTYLIIAEIVAANAGIGYVIWAAKRYVQTDEVFAGILTIGVIGLGTDQAIRALHRKAFPYLR